MIGRKYPNDHQLTKINHNYKCCFHYHQLKQSLNSFVVDQLHHKDSQVTPQCRSRALELIQGGLHFLSEIFHITNISKGTLGDLRKCNSSLNKVHSGHPLNLSNRHKYQIIFYITKNYEFRHFTLISIISNFELNISLSTLKHTLKDLGYNHRIA